MASLNHAFLPLLTPAEPTCTPNMYVQQLARGLRCSAESFLSTTAVTEESDEALLSRFLNL